MSQLVYVGSWYEDVKPKLVEKALENRRPVSSEIRVALEKHIADYMTEEHEVDAAA